MMKESDDTVKPETSPVNIANAMGKLQQGEAKNDWITPKDVFKYICEKYVVTPTVDACATRYNTKCDKFVSPEQDFFKTEIKENFFLNPEYRKSEPKKNIKGIGDFVARAYELHIKYNLEVTMLFFSVVTSTPWYQKLCGERDVNYLGEQCQCFKYPKRIQFLDADNKPKGTPPMSSLVLVWRREPEYIIEMLRKKFQDAKIQRFDNAS